MQLPTLLVKGKLVPPSKKGPSQSELNEWIPIKYIVNWFKERERKSGMQSRVLVLKSETASGKSTALPPELFRQLVLPRQKAGKAPGLICTQPRVITAIKNLEEIIKYNSDILRLGENTGWSTKYNKFRPKQFGLLSATIGTLTQQLQTMTDDEICETYSHILIDETHERDLTTDMTILMLKNLLYRLRDRVDCPFVALMSATFDPQPFIDYFGLTLEENFIWCRGETAGFDEMWDWNEGRTVNNFAQATATIVEKITTREIEDKLDTARNDILIFLPGAKEFRESEIYLQKLNKKFADELPQWVFSIIKIDSVAVNTESIDYKNLSLSLEEQKVRFDSKGDSSGRGQKSDNERDFIELIPIRRVIMSTNVAETGLTLPDLKYVIDAGFNREVEYNPIYQVSALVTKPAPKSRVTQRRGRAGRKFRGVFYPLYPKWVFEMLPENQYPQILTSDISIIMLNIILQQLNIKETKKLPMEFKLSDLDMVSVPSPDALADSLHKLYAIGFITPSAPSGGYFKDLESLRGAQSGGQRGAQSGVQRGATAHGKVSRDIPENNIDPNGTFGLTKLGYIATKFGLMRPEVVRMLLAAYSWGVHMPDIIAVAAYISMDPKDFALSGAKTRESQIDWNEIYKSGIPPFFKDPESLHRVRLVVGDSFIDGLILFNAIENASRSTLVRDLPKWCENVNLSYSTILKFIAARDTIMEQMLANQFDIFGDTNVRLHESDSTTFMNIIVKIKHCIYDGFRCNLLVYDPTGGQYNYKGLPVVGPEMFADLRFDYGTADYRERLKKLQSIVPQYVLFSSLGIKYNKNTQLYKAYIPSHYSTLDGFVSIDKNFTI